MKTKYGIKKTILPVTKETECQECRKIFKYIKMWKFPFYAGKKKIMDLFICMKCGQDRKAVERIIERPPRKYKF